MYHATHQSFPNESCTNFCWQASFPKDRIVSPTEGVYKKTVDVLRELFGQNRAAWPRDRLGPVHDTLIAVTPLRMGAIVSRFQYYAFRSRRCLANAASCPCRSYFAIATVAI